MHIKSPSLYLQVVLRIIIATVILTFSLGLLVPIYSDEIAIHLAKSRFFFENGLLINLFPQCNNYLTAQIPFTWYPAAIFYGVVYGIPYSGFGGLGLRLIGVVLGLCWLFILWVWVGKLVQGTVARIVVRTLVISFNGLGVLPFVLILARSEQVLLLCLALYCMFSLFWRMGDSESIRVKVLKIFLFILLTSVFYYTHPKAIFFFPLVIVSAFLIFQKGKFYINFLIAILIGLATYQGLQQAKNIASDCREAPLVAHALANNTLDLHQFFENRTEFFQHASDNLRSSLWQVLDKVPFRNSYQSGWLPPSKNQQIGVGIQFFGDLIQKSLFLFCIGLIGVFIVQLIQQALSRRIRPKALLASAIVFGLLVHGTIYNMSTWHFYTPGLIVPIFILFFLLLLPDNIEPNAKWVFASYGLAAYWMALALVSMGILLYLTLPRLIEIADDDKYLISDQPLSVPIFLGERRREELLSLARRCDIDPIHTERLVVDGVAYLELKNQREPINVLYVSDYGFGMDVSRNLGAYLARMNSDGVLSRCDYLPEMMRKNAITSGGMCCISRRTWSK
ncbi:hypothetical protein [Collimonas antrihumi]|uniref:hypothetical protein n=1 Tax=Collimonas antrihumi TaxID=1940615 RepID=UPI001B8B26C5|nr:hypothetical protein [Collimonas antrihumi]